VLADGADSWARRIFGNGVQMSFAHRRTGLESEGFHLGEHPSICRWNWDESAERVVSWPLKLPSLCFVAFVVQRQIRSAWSRCCSSSTT
jgi:hypothetical protein